jgi:hypothetical protein
VMSVSRTSDRSRSFRPGSPCSDVASQFAVPYVAQRTVSPSAADSLRT